MRVYLKTIAAVASAAAMLSCTDKECTIEGTVEDVEELEKQEVYFIASREKIDTVAIVDGKFSFTCPIDEFAMYNVNCIFENRPRGKRFTTQVIPDSKLIKISLGPESTVSGSELTSKYLEVMDGTMVFRKKGDFDGFMDYCKNAYRENSTTIIGEKLLQIIVRDLSVEEMDELLALGNERTRNNPSYERIRAEKIAAEATAIGTSFIDFSGVSPDGKEVRLSDFVGKSQLTLVDFWASWCGPCMRSMPAMVSLWKKWHSKGLDIVGVAVWDGDNSASRVKMKEMGMLWPQIFVGDDKSATEAYGITGIPHVLILDKEGKILLRGIPDESEIEKLVSGALSR